VQAAVEMLVAENHRNAPATVHCDGALAYPTSKPEEGGHRQKKGYEASLDIGLLVLCTQMEN